MTTSEELSKLVGKQFVVVAGITSEFYSELIKLAPVKTGSFRSAWKIDKNDDNSWTISNDMEYADVLWNGLRRVEGRWFGSAQWVEGGDLYLKKYDQLLQDRLNKL